MKKVILQIKALMILIMLFSFGFASAQSLFYTTFNEESGWDNPEGTWGSYNQKTYAEGGWEFTAESSIRDTDVPLDGSSYLFRNRGDFTIIATVAVEDMIGVRFMMRDWRSNPKATRNVMYSTNGGVDWSLAMVIDEDFFPDGDNFYPVEFYFPLDKQSFDANEFHILIEGDSNNNNRLRIGSFEVLGAGNVFYVTEDGDDNNNGYAWGAPFASVQKGIDAANAQAGSFEVWVAEGTYSPTEYLEDIIVQETGISHTDDEFKAFIMYSGTNVYGGFAGDETTKDVGVPGGRQLSGTNPWEFANQTILDGSATNSYHVVWYGSNGFSPYDLDFGGLSIPIMIANPLDEITVMDGFTITGGFAGMDMRIENDPLSIANYMHLSGGGVAINGNGELHNCIVENNTAKYGGGGIAMFDGAVVNQCLITNNNAIGANFYEDGTLGFGSIDYWRTDGAGIAAIGSEDNSNLISNSVISNNVGESNDNYPGAPSADNNKFNNGGGVYLANSIMQNTIVAGNNIAVNPSPYAGGAHASCGGGVYLYSRGIVDDCEITDNGFLSGSQNAAGIFIADYGTETVATDYYDLILKNSYVHSNRAGGAIAVDAQFSTIENTKVANNTGSGIYGYGNCKNNRVVNCIIFNNSGAGWVHSASENNQDNQLINSTVVRNNTGVSIAGTDKDHLIYNSIVWGNNSNPATINANATVNNSAFSFVPPAGNNFQLDDNNADGPMFVDPTINHGTGIAGWETANWNLQEESPCIDAGDMNFIPVANTTDFYGNDRVQSCNADLGYFETTFTNNVIADAGETQSHCGLISDGLGGNAVVVPTMIAEWSVFDGIGNIVFSDENDGNATATADDFGAYTLRWTIPQNGNCDATHADIIVNFYQDPGIADAGVDQEVFGFISNNLEANTPDVGNGVWTVVDGTGNAMFDDENNPNTIVTVDDYGTYTFEWTFEDNGPCTGSSDQLEIEFKTPPTPWIEYTEVLDSYVAETEIVVEARIFSDGLIDDLCGVGYEIYKDDVLVENVSDYGSFTYRVRQVGDEYYDGVLTEGSGMIEIETGGYEVGAFTLGIFDNYCVDRNRPVEFTAVVDVPGIYRLVSYIYECENNGTGTGTTYTAVHCDGLEYEDRIAATCENPTLLAEESVELTITEVPLPYVEFTELEDEYETGTDVEATARVYSNGLIDDLCGVGYEIYHNDILITDISDFGTLNYTVRQVEDEYYDGEITDGSGMIYVEIAEYEIGAFTLGIFDNYCVQRNRPIDFTANFDVAGEYRMEMFMYACENEGTGLGTFYTAVDCDGLEYEDRIAAECVNPTQLSTETLLINIFEPILIEITQQPVDQVICEDEFAIFTVEAESDFEIAYQWFFNDEEIEDATENSIEVNVAGEYYCMLTVDDEVVYTDVVTLTISIPVIDWPETIEYCIGSTVVLDPGIFETYLWSDDSEEPTLEVTESGEYSVTVTNEFGCIATETVTVEFVEEITVDLGGVIEACVGDEVVITAPEGDYYIWSTGTTNQSIIVTEPGIYSLTLTQGVCIASDEVEVIFNELPEEFELGADIFACDGEEITISGPEDAFEYLWSTGEDTESIVVTETGTYTLHVYNSDGCYVSSDIYVEFNDFLVISLHDEDTIYACANYPVILDPVAMGGDVEWLWDGGTSTDDTLSVTEAGWYYVTVTRETCVGNDEVYVYFYELPEIDLGPDLAFCDGFTEDITAPEGFDYLWNTGEMTQQITVDTAGLYICTITDMYGCFNSDQVLVTIYELPNIDLGSDLTIDEDQTIMLAVEAGHIDYLWSTGETSDFIMIHAEDYGLGVHVFSVTVTSAQGCIVSDEITITIVEGLDVDLLSADNVKIYPNPVSERLFIQLPFVDADMNISITSITGQIISNINPNSQLVEIDVIDIAPGMYFVIIDSKNQKIINKIVIE